MKGCFALRFNLEKQANPATENNIKALSALFEIREEELLESVDYYRKILNENVLSFNRRISEEAKDKFCKKSIAFFGDSLTSDRISYARIINELKIFRKVDIFAVSGNISSQLIKGMKEKAVWGKYDYICVFIGTNDCVLADSDFPVVSVNEFERNIGYTVATISKSGAKGVFISLPAYEARIFSDYEIYNEILLKSAEKYDFRVLEIKNIAPKFIEDGIHLDGKTQFRLAEMFLKELVKY